MKSNNLKKIMTDLAAGHITQLEAEELIQDKITQPGKPEEEKQAFKSKDQIKINKKGGKIQSHKTI